MKGICEFCNIKSKAASKLSKTETERLSFSCTLLKFKKGHTLIRQGTYATDVIYLRKGLAKIHINGPHREQVVRIVKAPTYLALPTTFGEKMNQYSVTLIEEAEVCSIDLDTFRYLLKENYDFSYEILMELCRNEIDIYNRCVNRTQKQIRARVADVLLELSGKIYGSVTFKLPLTQEEVGNLVDSSRETISRVLAQFVKEGVINLYGRKIEILNNEILNMISVKG